MDSLPPEIKALRRIKELLDKLMSDRATPVEIRSNALYECITKDSHLRKIFPVQKTFNQFLRQEHNNSILKQLIPNYRVDTSDRLHYQWFFFRETNKAGRGKGIETSDSKLAYKANELKVVSSNGQKFRSSQEKDIYERLLTCDYLSIDLEFPISKHGEKRYADFKILNRITQKTYYWEHFGMTNSSKYMDAMTNKLEWYRSNGFKTVENGGNAIFTIYSESKAFQRDIDRYITLIL